MPLALLFDLDGTLVDTLELLLSSVRHAFRHRSDRAPSVAEWTAGIGTPLHVQLGPWAADDAELAGLVAGYREFQLANHDRLTRAYPGVHATVAALHAAGHRCALVTSKADAIARRTLAHVDLLRFMDEVVGADSTTRHKPDPEPVYLALERLGVAAEDAVFVGDSPHDVHAGNAAGVRTVAARWGFFGEAALTLAQPTVFLDRIEGLPALVQRLERDAPAR